MAPITEVDLHTRAFHRNTAGLTAEDMVRLSIDRMRSALDAAIRQGQQEIRFIHGQGTGALKERIYHELRIYEKNGLIESFEPSFFNSGVVNVIIRY
ncbi:Smr/MutS family protein [Parapedobacter koreensis]|uniref:Smr domain-containing protein n=1 Tax=Parapedobacter koreensis TaxID=332977 RepID=A0A1H7UHL7_9SPHI|nr:Smr/MutS family protein [Parapedobacter koreensis]SEL96255.1 Smr domain-containing protein [Parapedobacter koreensis]